MVTWSSMESCYFQDSPLRFFILYICLVRERYFGLKYYRKNHSSPASPLSLATTHNSLVQTFHIICGALYLECEIYFMGSTIVT